MLPDNISTPTPMPMLDLVLRVGAEFAAAAAAHEPRRWEPLEGSRVLVFTNRTGSLAPAEAILMTASGRELFAADLPPALGIVTAAAAQALLPHMTAHARARVIDALEHGARLAFLIDLVDESLRVGFQPNDNQAAVEHLGTLARGAEPIWH